MVNATLRCYLSLFAWMLLLLALANAFAFLLVPLAILLLAALTAGCEYLVNRWSLRRYHRARFVLIAGMLLVALTAAYNACTILTHHTLNYDLLHFAVAFTAIPALMHMHGEWPSPGELLEHVLPGHPSGGHLRLFSLGGTTIEKLAPARIA